MFLVSMRFYILIFTWVCVKPAVDFTHVGNIHLVIKILIQNYNSSSLFLKIYILLTIQFWPNRLNFIKKCDVRVLYHDIVTKKNYLILFISDLDLYAHMRTLTQMYVKYIWKTYLHTFFWPPYIDVLIRKKYISYDSINRKKN